MTKEEVPLIQLRQFLPEGSFEMVYPLLLQYKVHLTITRKRETVLGDFRHKYGNKSHRISVNGNLNQFSFLITLLHELAHLFTYEQFYNRVQPHGKEWKVAFGEILNEFLIQKIFPSDIEKALLKSIANPAASTCGDLNLLRVLKKYDPIKEGVVLVEQLPVNALFSIKNNRIFRKVEKMRTRYKCIEVATGRCYLFSGVYEVVHIENN